MIGFNEYTKVCNNYCVGYFGYCNDYLVQLGLLRPILELNFPDLNIYIACRDESAYILADDPKFIKLSEFMKNKRSFAHFNELQYDGMNHPVEKFLTDSCVSNYSIKKQPAIDYTARCVILTKSFYPTKDLTESQVTQLKIIAEHRGFSIDINGNARGAALVMGVEHAELFRAAANGTETTLIPTGVGTHLYKKMFPEAKIFDMRR